MNKSGKVNILLSYLNSHMYKLQVITNVRRNQININDLISFILYIYFRLNSVFGLKHCLVSITVFTDFRMLTDFVCLYT
jgi:hypothetical protein